MQKVNIILVIYNAKKYIQPVFESIFSQTYKNFDVTAIINGNDDGSKELIAQNFPQVKIIDPGQNLFFSKGNNLGILSTRDEFVFLVNQDVILEPDHLDKLVRVFDDHKVAAATGKLLRYDFEKNEKTKVIDTTGIIISSSGRAKDRGQLEIDRGQYDTQREIFGVSGACPIYRRSALEAVAYMDNGKCEYFDEDFYAYWEDVDLSWRMQNAGWKCVYVPEAVGFHGRTAGQSKGGYLHVLHYIKHHRQLSPMVRKLNYKNHILMYLKNTRFIHPAFILREIAMLGYIIVFETSTLAVVPQLLKQIPRIWKKRKAAQQLSKKRD